MNIKSLNFSTINKLTFKGIDNNRVNSNPITSKQDAFVKTTQTEASKKDYSLDEVKKLYDSVLLDSLKLNFMTNPILKSVKLEKPKVGINSNPNFIGAASYNFTSNTVSVSEKVLKEDLFLCYSEGKNGITTLGILTDDKLKEEVENYKKLGVETKTLKLNEKEKEFFIASCLAHETRHFLQAHLIASADGLSENYKKEQIEATKEYNSIVSDFNRSLKEAQSCANEAVLFGEPVPKEIKELLETQKPMSYIDTKYAENYNPHKPLDPNTMFKFSALPQDKRSMTIENLYDAVHRKVVTTTKQDKNEYYSNLTEIDAYNYGFEYTCATRRKFADGARQLVIEAIATDAQRSSALGMMYAKEENILPSTMN